MDLTPEEFFDFRVLSRHRVIFDGLTFVWEALTRLRDYLKDHVKGLPEGIPVGEPLQEGLVIYKGEVLPFRAVNLRFQDEGSVVEYQGEELLGASIIFPGAVFGNRRVEIAEGVIIEPGPLLEGRPF